jgi:hypothetical protein
MSFMFSLPEYFVLLNAWKVLRVHNIKRYIYNLCYDGLSFEFLNILAIYFHLSDHEFAEDCNLYVKQSRRGVIRNFKSALFSRLLLHLLHLFLLFHPSRKLKLYPLLGFQILLPPRYALNPSRPNNREAFYPQTLWQ